MWVCFIVIMLFYVGSVCFVFDKCWWNSLISISRNRFSIVLLVVCVSLMWN